MSEIENGVIEETVDTALEDWDLSEGAEVEETETEETETETEETETDAGETESEASEADPAEDEQSDEDPAQDGGDTEKAGADGDLTVELKHLGEVRKVGREELVSLAQKGMDYERVRTKLDEARQENTRLGESMARLSEYESFLKELAGGKDIDSLVDETRARMLAQRDGVDITVAAERIRLQKQQRELEQQRSQLTRRQSEQEQAAAAEEKRKADFMAFAAEFPSVDPKTITQKVWDAYNRGLPLTDAYRAEQLAEENRRLAAELEAAKKNKENKARSTGSRKSAGNSTSTDPFDEAWAD